MLSHAARPTLSTPQPARTSARLILTAPERRAALAERSTLDRYTTAFMADRVGARFSGRVSGVARFGLFVTLDETGADGLIPVSTLPADYYHHDADRHSLIGDRSRRIYTLGDRVEVTLVEADPIAGGMVFALIEADGRVAKGRGPSGPPRRGGASFQRSRRRAGG